MKNLYLIILLVVICCSCSMQLEEHWLDFDVPEDIQKLHDEGGLQSVADIDKWCWGKTYTEVYPEGSVSVLEMKIVITDNIKYTYYKGERKNPKDVLKSKKGNCVDISKTVAALSYKLLGETPTLVIVSVNSYKDHCSVLDNGNIYSNGKKKQKIERHITFNNIPFDDFVY